MTNRYVVTARRPGQVIPIGYFDLLDQAKQACVDKEKELGNSIESMDFKEYYIPFTLTSGNKKGFHLSYLIGDSQK